MTTKPFGTLALARDLEAAGVANGQAQAIAAGIRDARADLVTKADLDAALAALESRQEAKLANAVNRMLLGNIAAVRRPQAVFLVRMRLATRCNYSLS